jgi:hypothetical protein
MSYSASDLLLNAKIKNAAQTADHITTYNIDAITNNVGKWIDGKNIHRAIFDVSEAAQDLTGGTEISSVGRLKIIDITSTWPDHDNCDTVLDYRVIIKDTDTGVFTNGAYLAQTAAVGADFGFSAVYNGAGAMILVIGADGPTFNVPNLKMFIIVEYTKLVE